MGDPLPIRIRPPHPGDETAIGALSHRAGSTAAPDWTPIHSIESEIAWARSVVDAPDPATAVLVAVNAEDQVIGFVAVLPATDLSGHRHGHIGSIAVSPEWEGQGVGNALLAAAEE